MLGKKVALAPYAARGGLLTLLQHLQQRCSEAAEQSVIHRFRAEQARLSAPIEEQQRERDTGQEQGVEPAVEELELELPTQHLRDHRPAAQHILESRNARTQPIHDEKILDGRGGAPHDSINIIRLWTVRRSAAAAAPRANERHAGGRSRRRHAGVTVRNNSQQHSTCSAAAAACG